MKELQLKNKRQKRVKNHGYRRPIFLDMLERHRLTSYRLPRDQRSLELIRISADLVNRSANLHFSTGGDVNTSTFIIQIGFNDLSAVVKTCIDVLAAQKFEPHPVKILS